MVKTAAQIEAMTYEQIVEKCKEMRRTSERAYAEFFAYLMMIEAKYEDIWKGAGCATFDQFLLSNHLCKPERFRLFSNGVSFVGLDDALKNGAAWTMAAGRMGDQPKSALKEFSARAEAFIETEKVAPTEETVREWKNQIEEKTEVHRTRQKVDELHQLRAENIRLKGELAAAKKRIKDLETQLGRTKTKKAA